MQEFRIERLTNNLSVYHLPHITWYSRIFQGNYPSLVLRIRKILSQVVREQDNIDLIHAHNAFPAGYLAWQISQQLGIPYIITEHSGPFPFPEHILRGSLRREVLLPLQQAAALIAVSSIVKSQMQSYTNKDITIVPNQVDTAFFSVMDNQPQTQNELTIFTLSWLTAEKGIGDLLRAYRMVLDKGLNAKLRIGGTGKGESRFKRLANQLGLNEHIVWLGRLSRSEALAEYQQCTFYVMPSRSESLSMVILEAMACGKPVVATACGGPSDLVIEQTGILVEPANPTALAQGIIDIIYKLGIYSQQAIRHYCVSRYSPQVINAALMTVYQAVLADNPTVTIPTGHPIQEN